MLLYLFSSVITTAHRRIATFCLAINLNQQRFFEILVNSNKESFLDQNQKIGMLNFLDVVIGPLHGIKFALINTETVGERLTFETSS